MKTTAPQNLSGRDARYITPSALEKLRATLIELFSEGLFHQVGIRDICQRASVSSKTVYKYFGNKEQLLEACIEQDLQQLADATRRQVSHETGFEAQLTAFIETFFGFYETRPEIARMVYLNVPSLYWLSSQSKGHRAHGTITSEIFSRANASGAMRQDVSEFMLIQFFAGTLNRTISAWLYRKYVKQPSDDKLPPLSGMSTECTTLIMAGLIAPPGI